MSIYVEIRIRGSMDQLWDMTQTPSLHQRWDLRFTDIEYLPKSDASQPQRFLYATRVGFGIAIRGEGESIASCEAANGVRTSSLKFWSQERKSLIETGAGYWQYVPTHDGIRFLTSYDYRVRCGALGRLFDALVFRPLLGWATAWSFDRLRLWIEKGINPLVSLQRAFLHVLATWVVAFVWIYHGAVPKLLSRHHDELTLILNSGFTAEQAPLVLQLLGVGEIVAGLAVLAQSTKRWPYLLTIVLMVAALAGVILRSPSYLWAAFNPVTLNVLMIAMCVVGLVTLRDLPSAGRCLRVKPDSNV